MAQMLETRPRPVETAAPRPAEAAVRPAATSGRHRRVAPGEWALLGVLAAAFGLRVWQLGHKSLWLDEGISATFSLDGPPKLFDTLARLDDHPPLYYLTLHYWMHVGGTSETSVRFPSVLVGVLLVALLYRFARQLYPGAPGRLSGWLAAGLATFSPFLIATAQEARMYGALATAGLGATCALHAAFARGGLGRWAAYGFLLAVVPYVHHFGWMVVAAHGSFVVLTLRRRRRRAVAWVLAAAGAVVAYLPWLPLAARQILRMRETPDFWMGALSFTFVVQHAFAAFAVGFGGALQQYWLVAAVFVAAAVLGLVALVGRGVLGGHDADLLVVVYLVVPLGTLYAIVASNPKFADRYLIVILPPFLLLLARGIVGIGELVERVAHRSPPARVAGYGLAGILALALLGASLREGLRVYWDEPYAKDDYRGAVDYIIRNWRDGDAVLLMLDTWQVFEYYSHGWLPRYGLSQADPTTAAQKLNTIANDGHKRLWVLMWNPDWADPSGEVRALLDNTVERLPAQAAFRGLQLRLYDYEGMPAFFADLRPPRPLEAQFGDALRLYGLDPGPGGPIVAGDHHRIGLYWQPLRAMPEDYKLSLRLVRGGHEWWRKDERPGAYTFPTTYWNPDRPVRGTFDLAIPPGTPPGEYQLQVVVYQASDGKELPVKAPGGPDTAVFTVGTFAVARPAAPPPPSTLPVPAANALVGFGGLDLLGGAVSAAKVDAGASLEVAAAWRVLTPQVDRPVAVSFADAGGKVWPLSEAAPLDGAYPFSSWLPGEVGIDRRTVRIPAGAAAGLGRLLVGVAPTGASAALATVEVVARAHQLAPPAGGTPSDARLGDFARLASFELPPTVERGGQLRIVLNWQALRETDRAYSVFVHLVDTNERPLAQRDAVPGNGAYPTTGWVAGEYLRDEALVPVGAGVPPGAYRVVVGLYSPSDGARLSATLGGASVGDRVVLGTVTVR